MEPRPRAGLVWGLVIEIGMMVTPPMVMAERDVRHKGTIITLFASADGRTDMVLVLGEGGVQDSGGAHWGWDAEAPSRRAAGNDHPSGQQIA